MLDFSSQETQSNLSIDSGKIQNPLANLFAVSDNYLQLVQQALAGSPNQPDTSEIMISASSPLLLAPSGSNFDEINLKQVNIPSPTNSTLIIIG